MKVVNSTATILTLYYATNSIGTIFGIFQEDPNAVCLIQDNDEEELAKCMTDTLQPGKNLIAAGYCLYSSSCFFCLTLGNGVNIFTLDRQIGEFVLTASNVKIPKRGKIYSFNEANRWDWEKPMTEYVTDIQQGKGQTRNQYSSRYIGSMVCRSQRFCAVACSLL